MRAAVTTASATTPTLRTAGDLRPVVPSMLDVDHRPFAPAVTDPRLESIAEKVRVGRRLSLADGEVRCSRRRTSGRCANCQPCWTACTPGGGISTSTGTSTTERVRAVVQVLRVLPQEGSARRVHEVAGRCAAEVRRAVENGATEMHMVGGLTRTCREFYPELVSAVRDERVRLGPIFMSRRLPLSRSCTLRRSPSSYARIGRRGSVRC